MTTMPMPTPSSDPSPQSSPVEMTDEDFIRKYGATASVPPPLPTPQTPAPAPSSSSTPSVLSDEEFARRYGSSHPAPPPLSIAERAAQHLASMNAGHDIPPGYTANDLSNPGPTDAGGMARQQLGNFGDRIVQTAKAAILPSHGIPLPPGVDTAINFGQEMGAHLGKAADIMLHDGKMSDVPEHVARGIVPGLNVVMNTVDAARQGNLGGALADVAMAEAPHAIVPAIGAIGERVGAGALSQYVKSTGLPENVAAPLLDEGATFRNPRTELPAHLDTRIAELEKRLAAMEGTGGLTKGPQGAAMDASTLSHIPGAEPTPLPARPPAASAVHGPPLPDVYNGPPIPDSELPAFAPDPNSLGPRITPREYQGNGLVQIEGRNGELAPPSEYPEIYPAGSRGGGQIRLQTIGDSLPLAEQSSPASPTSAALAAHPDLLPPEQFNSTRPTTVADTLRPRDSASISTSVSTPSPPALPDISTIQNDPAAVAARQADTMRQQIGDMQTARDTAAKSAPTDTLPSLGSAAKTLAVGAGVDAAAALMPGGSVVKTALGTAGTLGTLGKLASEVFGSPAWNTWSAAKKAAFSAALQSGDVATVTAASQGIAASTNLARDVMQSKSFAGWGPGEKAAFGRAAMSGDAGAAAAVASQADQRVAGVSDPVVGALFHLSPAVAVSAYNGDTKLAYVDPTGQITPLPASFELTRSSGARSDYAPAGAPNENEADLRIHDIQSLLPDRFRGAKAAKMGSPLSGVIEPLKGQPAPNLLGMYGASFDAGDNQGHLVFPSGTDHRPDYKNTVLLSRKAGENWHDPMTDVPMHELGHAAKNDLTPQEWQAFTQKVQNTWDEFKSRMQANHSPVGSEQRTAYVEGLRKEYPKVLVDSIATQPRTANDEIFAEMFAQYIANPHEFERRDPQWYAMMKGLFGGREYKHNQ